SRREESLRAASIAIHRRHGSNAPPAGTLTHLPPPLHGGRTHCRSHRSGRRLGCCLLQTLMNSKNIVQLRLDVWLLVLTLLYVALYFLGIGLVGGEDQWA